MYVYIEVYGIIPILAREKPIRLIPFELWTAIRSKMYSAKTVFCYSITNIGVTHVQSVKHQTAQNQSCDACHFPWPDPDLSENNRFCSCYDPSDSHTSRRSQFKASAARESLTETIRNLGATTYDKISPRRNETT